MKTQKLIKKNRTNMPAGVLYEIEDNESGSTKAYRLNNGVTKRVYGGEQSVFTNEDGTKQSIDTTLCVNSDGDYQSEKKQL